MNPAIIFPYINGRCKNMHSHKPCVCAWISALFLSAFKLKQWIVHWQMNKYNHKMEIYPSVKANDSLLQQESMLKILCCILKKSSHKRMHIILFYLCEISIIDKSRVSKQIAGCLGLTRCWGREMTTEY